MNGSIERCENTAEVPVASDPTPVTQPTPVQRPVGCGTVLAACVLLAPVVLALLTYRMGTTPASSVRGVSPAATTTDSGSLAAADAIRLRAEKLSRLGVLPE